MDEIAKAKNADDSNKSEEDLYDPNSYDVHRIAKLPSPDVIKRRKRMSINQTTEDDFLADMLDNLKETPKDKKDSKSNTEADSIINKNSRNLGKSAVMEEMDLSSAEHIESNKERLVGDDESEGKEQFRDYSKEDLIDKSEDSVMRGENENIIQDSNGKDTVQNVEQERLISKHQFNDFTTGKDQTEN